jgi:FxLD family lantipeptide
MPITIAELDQIPAADPFALDIQVITDVAASDATPACTTNDGCGSTCPSACVSGV